MSQQQKMRVFLGILKDKISLIKLSLSAKRTTSSVKAVVLRGTVRGTAVLPSEKRVDAVLAIGKGSRAAARRCASALIDRLHSTRNSFVALKCLYIVHSIITKGSFVFRDELSSCIYVDHRNHLNLLTFRDNRDAESWELSSWGRWSARVLEQNLITSRVVGNLCSPSWKISKEGEKKVLESSNSALLERLENLASFVEQICSFPDSLHVLKNDIVHEIVMMVSEDYRVAQREILLRVVELGNRAPSLSSSELTRSRRALKKLQGCRERVFLLFVNRKRNDEFWGLVSQLGIELKREQACTTKNFEYLAKKRPIPKLISLEPPGR